MTNYIITTIVALTVAYVIVAPLAKATGENLNNTAELIIEATNR